MNPQLTEGTKINNYRIGRSSLQIVVQQEEYWPGGNEWSSVARISDRTIVNGKQARYCTDDELLDDWRRGSWGEV